MSGAGSCGVAVNTYKDKCISSGSIGNSVFKARTLVYGIHHINRCSAALKFGFKVFTYRKVDFVFTVIGKESESTYPESTVAYVNNNRNTGKA